MAPCASALIPAPVFTELNRQVGGKKKEKEKERKSTRKNNAVVSNMHESCNQFKLNW